MIIYHYYRVLKGFRAKLNLVEWNTAKHALNNVYTSLQTSNDLGSFIEKIYASINTKLTRPQNIRWFAPSILKILFMIDLIVFIWYYKFLYFL